MSTILDALRRLERDHSQPANARSLREAVAGGVSPAHVSPSMRWRAPLATLLMGVGLGAGLLLLWSGEPEPAVGESEGALVSSSLREAEVLTVPAVVSPAALPALPQRIPLEDPPDVAVLERPPATLRSPIEWSTGDPEPPTAASSADGSVQEAAPGPAARAIQPAAPAPSPPASAQPAEPTRVLRRVPVAAVAQPELLVRVERTLWHPRAERRLAVLRMPGQSEFLRLREGDELGGFRVTHIEPSQVVFERDGVQLVRRLETP